MKLLIEELRGTNRAIVTNLAVLPPELAEYLHDKYGETFDLLERLTIIEDDEIEFFYCHRGRGLEKLPLEMDKKGRPAAFDIAAAQASGGVFYLLDEVHLKFGARNWQNMGQAATFYSSQHRKLGDDVVLISQSPKMVDTTFRALAQDYVVLRNHALEKIFFFRQPKVFSRQTFLNLPTANEKPQEKSILRYDLDGIMKTYDTSQGIGIHERGDADTKDTKKKGFHWGYGLAGFAVLLLGLFQVPSMCGKVVSDKVVKTNRNVTKRIVGDANKTMKLEKMLRDNNQTPMLEVLVPEPEPEPEPEKKSEIVGFYTKGRGDTWDMICLTATGEKLSFQSGDFSEITSTHVTGIDGVKHYFQRPIDVLRLRGLRD